MKRWKLGELARATEAEVLGLGSGIPADIETVGTDSRSLPPGCLFVALRGERFDGHDFVFAAVANGARAVLIDRRAQSDGLGCVPVPCLVVDDTLRALGALAAYERRRLGVRVVAVTGSNGKTTTKELIAAVLAHEGAVHKTAGNLNNLIGLPLTVLRCPDDVWAAVLEMGMNVPGEIARLTQIAAPNVGVVTNVAPAHLEGLGSVQAVARAKGELYAGLGAEAVAVVNGDDLQVTKICVPLLNEGQRVLRFGLSKGCDVQVTHSEPAAAGLRLRLRVLEDEVWVQLPLYGAHNGVNAAAAAAAGAALGMGAEAIARGLHNVRVPGGRLRLVPIPHRSVQVLDDTYNANPASMRAAFAALSDVAGTARRLAVLGDMFELGSEAESLHREVGGAAARSGVNWVLCVGPQSFATAQGARQVGARAEVYDSMEELIAALLGGLQRSDCVLVKGSRGMRMERVVQALEASADGRTAVVEGSED